MAKQRSFAQPPPDPGGLRQRIDALRSAGLGGYAAEAAGLLVLAVALLTLLGLSGLSSGAWLDPWVGLWRRWLGWGSWLVVAGLALAGWNLLAQRRMARGFPMGRLVAFEGATFAALGLLSLALGQSLEVAEAGQAGGLIGWGLAESLRLLFGSLLPDWLALGLAWLILLALFAYSLLLVISRRRSAAEIHLPPPEPVLSISPVEAGAEFEFSEPLAEPSRPRREPVPRKNLGIDAQPAKAQASAPRAAELPPLALLMEEKSSRPDERQINQMAGKLEQTLADFGVPARVVGFQIGPTVTQFAVEPGYIQRPGEEDNENRQKVRVAQISALQRDLALALSAQRLRIQAPVPGRAYVGIEVPNARTTMVRLRPILENAAFQKLASSLGLALGRDVSGTPIAADLGKMPHLLVAGTTGSGKSVLMSAIAICLVMNNTPNDLRLVMLDPKRVELVRFNGLPHMLGKVETDLERIGAVLRWLVGEMQRRYKLLESESARDLAAYNQKAARGSGEHLPRIVVLIDELADLMMATAEHTESTLVRLAQMARAVGIHLVVATQRPSTDVVTGLIKANFPARISFAVASSVDSRVILDTSGAEALLGRGDMLYLAPEAAAPLRSQGVMISDKEIEAVINYWQGAWPQDAPEQMPWDALVQRDATIGDRDSLVDQAIEVIRKTGKSSASHLQRAMRIGYPRAARLVDELEEMGVLGPVQSGGKEREVLINLDNYDTNNEEEDPE